MKKFKQLLNEAIDNTVLVVTFVAELDSTKYQEVIEAINNNISKDHIIKNITFNKKGEMMVTFNSQVNITLASMELKKVISGKPIFIDIKNIKEK